MVTWQKIWAEEAILAHSLLGSIKGKRANASHPNDILMSLDSANFWWLIRMPGKLILNSSVRIHTLAWEYVLNDDDDDGDGDVGALVLVGRRLTMKRKWACQSDNWCSRTAQPAERIELELLMGCLRLNSRSGKHSEIVRWWYYYRMIGNDDDPASSQWLLGRVWSAIWWYEPENSIGTLC